MASSSRRDDQGSESPAKAPSFFKIILDTALRDGKLEIPQAVVMKHGNCLSDSVFLRVPSGAVWEIELESCSGKVWLQKGWPEFAKFYSLKHGYLVMFSYEGDYSCFQVRIFHRNNLEMDYPFSSSNNEEPNLFGRFNLPEGEELEDDVSVEILDSPPRKTREGANLISPRPRKMMRTNFIDKAKGKYDPSCETKGQGRMHDREKKSSGSPSSPKKYGGGDVGMSTAMVSSEGPPKIAQGNTGGSRTRAFLRATRFKSENPFLVVSMQPTYVSTHLSLCVSFVKQHICAKGACNVNLQISDGRTWPVRCVVVTYEGITYARVYKGWRAFARENHLKVGDACVFELIGKGPRVTLKVGIYRAKHAN